MTLSRCMAWLLLACCLVGCDSPGPDPDTKVADPNQPVIVDTNPVANQISLTIHFDQPGKEDINVRLDHVPEMTVMDVLVEASETNGFAIDYTGTGETAFVNSIGDVVGGEGNGLWWIFRVNQEIAHQGSGVYRLEPGDKVEWRLGNYE